jgi:heat shock protein 1/8
MVSVGYVIGIDLGTQNTRTAVFRDNTAEIVPHNGETSMPSCVAFTETCRLVGSAAESQAGLNPSNTIYGALRFVGGGFEKTGIEDTLSSVPFTVKVKAGRTYFVVRYRHQELITTPVEILAMILARAQRDAQSYLGQGCQISGAVITIPTAFDLCQRQAVWDAACIARINPLRLMSAAVMACAEYALASGSTKPQNIMCIDYGARSLDIAVAVIDEGVIDVVALDGDNLIGGQDVDSLLVRYIAKTFERKWKLDPTTKPRPLHRLRIACEKAKCELSSQKRTLITMDSLVEDRTFEWSLTQQDFEECCSSLFRASMKPVKRIVNDTLENAQMNIGDITTVVVTGGSSRIPKFKSLLSKVMRGREIHEYQHQDCAAARGAAFYAAMLQGFIWSMAGIGLLVDVAPCPVRVQSFRGTTKTIFHKNMTFPQIKTATFKAPQDYEGPCRVAILEGFFAHNQDIVSVGNLDLQLLPTPHGIQEIEITVHYRTNHEIIVAAKVLGTDSQARISLSDPKRLQEDALKRIMAEHLELNLEEQREESRILVKQATEGYVVRLLDEIAICSDTSATREKKLLATSVLDWLDENPEAEASAYRSQLYDLKIKIQNVDGAELGQNILVTAPSLEQGAESSNRRNPPDDVRQNGSSSRTQDEPLREHKTSNSHGDTSIVPESTTIEVLLPSQLLHPASPHASESGINVLFVNTAKTGRIYTDSDFLNISTYLGNTGHSSWSTVPRLYAVLRLLNQLDMLDTFIEQDITDIWFPFTQASLPSTLSPTVRASFLDQQQVVLSKSLLFEKSSERKHTHFAQNEPNPFQVVAKLGSGAHGQVDKVMSTVSHREYARKQFRRQKGTNKDAIKSFLIELQVLKRVQHHHCIELVRLEL